MHTSHRKHVETQLLRRSVGPRGIGTHASRKRIRTLGWNAARVTTIVKHLERPRPLHGSRTPRQRAALWMLEKHHPVHRTAAIVHRAVILNVHHAVRLRSRHVDHARWSMSIAYILIPLVTQHALADPCDAVGILRALGETRIVPESQLRHRRGNSHRVITPSIDGENGSAQRVFRSRSQRVLWARVPERSSPLIFERVELGIRLRFLVADHNTMRCVRLVMLPANAPKVLIRTPKEKRRARAPCLLQCGELIGGGVLIVPERNKHLVTTQQFRATGIHVRRSDVADSVPIALQPHDAW
mmetsp:Transcript_6153/g.15924  ORF Transcript_6153/g.15924 Transcript_6153/m.15924 type:complete len:299 (-) Transcript_6153:1055-1951(-)